MKLTNTVSASHHFVRRFVPIVSRFFGVSMKVQPIDSNNCRVIMDTIPKTADRVVAYLNRKLTDGGKNYPDPAPNRDPSTRLQESGSV